MESYLQKQLNTYQKKNIPPSIAIFLMGIPGSGKSTIINSFISNILGLLLHHIYISDNMEEYNPNNFIVCNPDTIIEELEDYNIENHNSFLGKACRLNNKLLSLLLHPESTRYNFIYDSTGSQYGHYLRKINQAKDLKYFTILIDVRTNLLTCYERMLLRERKVNFKTIENLYDTIYTPKTNSDSNNTYQDLNNYEILEQYSDLSVIIENNETPKIVKIYTPEENIQEELKDFANLKI